MKKFLLFVVSLFLPVLFFPLLVSAQGEMASGYLVLTTNDTLYGQVAYIKERGFGGPRFYKNIRITDTRGRKKRYPRKKVAAFKIDNTVYQSFWLSQSAQAFPSISLDNPRYTITPRRGELHFLRVVQEGPLSHYKLEWFDQDGGTLWDLSLLKKEADGFFIRADQGLFGLKRAVLLNYFSDCSELREALQQKQLKKVAQVVDFYHKNCSP